MTDADQAAKYNSAFWLSTIRASLDLSRGRRLSPMYERGLAYLRWTHGPEAATEFQRILAHRTIAALSLVHPLSQLGLARARVLAGDVAGARTTYQDFFALWKDADPDIPILKQAKAEYAKLQ
jgi:hypothetical protein